MSTKLIYKRVSYSKTTIEYQQLTEGVYEPPDGWRVHSMAVGHYYDHRQDRITYDGYVYLLLEASVPTDGTPYRG